MARSTIPQSIFCSSLLGCPRARSSYQEMACSVSHVLYREGENAALVFLPSITEIRSEIERHTAWQRSRDYLLTIDSCQCCNPWNRYWHDRISSSRFHGKFKRITPLIQATGALSGAMSSSPTFRCPDFLRNLGGETHLLRLRIH